MTDTGTGTGGKELTLRHAQAVAARIAETRKEKGISVVEFAQRLTDLGLPTTKSQVWNLETRPRPLATCNVSNLMAYAIALDVAPMYLIAGDGEFEVLPGQFVSKAQARQWWIGAEQAADIVDVHGGRP